MQDNSSASPTVLRNLFERTVCECKSCAVGCHCLPGVLGPGDSTAIIDHLQIPEEQREKFFTENFCWSDGTIVMVQGHIRNLLTIVPKQQENGDCVFLKEGKCSIHPVSPFGCAYFDTHMDYQEADKRSRVHSLSCVNSKEYQKEARHLHDVGDQARPGKERHNNYLLLFRIAKQEAQ